jgi:HK97 family phage portal protein
MPARTPRKPAAPRKKASPRPKPATTRKPRTAAKKPPAQQRASWIDVGGGGLPIFTDGVNPETAIRVTAILAVVRFLAQSVASMPAHVVRTLPNGRKIRAADVPAAYALTRRPNSWQSVYEFIELLVYHAALHGNGYARVIPGERGFASELRPWHPTRTRVERLSDYSVRYHHLEQDGGWRKYPQEEVIHVRWLSDNGLVGLPPSELCATSVSLARKLDTAAASFWDNSARPDLVFETAERIPDEAIENLRRQMRDVYGGAKNRGSAAILPKKMQVKTIDGNSNEASQFMELRDAIVADVARAWGVPSTLIGDSKMARYSNVEQEFLTAQVFCLLPWQRRLEGAIDRTVLWPYQERGDEVHYKLDNRGLLRGDTASRVQLYQSMFNLGAITPNEVRDLEDFELLEDPAADQTFMQLGFSTLENAAAAAEQSPAENEAGGQGEGVPEAELQE